MKQFAFKGLLQNDGWKSNVVVTVDYEGIIKKIEENKLASDQSQTYGFAIPGFQNAHSHAFQYAMAGLAEVHAPSHTSDDFWSWREAMYSLALSITPDQMESIATMLYSEMLRHGYTNVAEFHYVHHDKNGNPFGNLAEMGERLISAAKKTGINITLVPIFYQKGGFGKNPTESQRRFISSTTDDYLKLLEASSNLCKHYDGANIGVGIHSMRGVDPSDIIEISKNGPQNIPFHIHIAEQLKEIEDSVSYLSKRPVEWLLENIDVNDRYHLVHATHLTIEECAGIAKSNANVVLCPSTEGNLGDGIFPLNDYQKNGGKWSIGTDSHIGISPFEELRLLDYGQRLISHKRNTFAIVDGDSGRFAIDMATTSGRLAMNDFSKNYFEVGQPFNACILDASNPLFATSSLLNLTSTILYTADSKHITGTISRGNLVSNEGNHTLIEKTKADFIKSLKELGNR